MGFLGRSRGCDGLQARSPLDDLSERLGALQANLIVRARFGASFDGISGVTGGDTGSAAGFATGSFLPPHAKVIRRFLRTAGATGSDLGDRLRPSAMSGSLFRGFVVGISECIAGSGRRLNFFDIEKGAKLVKTPLGGGGLGVLVREGLVSPSLVSSAVDAMLALLIMDLRRARSGMICKSGFEVGCSVVFSAIVRRDAFRSDWVRTADF